jgi:23S rRNA (guanosine2251-2'-O)-methyltransferase
MIGRERKIYLILHNIRSVHNVGSIFRTADGAGVTKIFLTGVTPAPIDRFNQIRKDFIKVALGAEQTVGWEKTGSIEKIITELKNRGIQIIVLEQNSKAIDYKNVESAADFALILGSEVGGLSQEILDQSDIICQIPMHGQKESLNVGVAAGIALFRILDI